MSRQAASELRKSNAQRFRRVRFEALESRQMLAANSYVQDTTSFPNSAAVQLAAVWDSTGDGRYDSEDSGGVCSGALITDYQVITAAHCIWNSSRGGYADWVFVHAGRNSEYNRPYGEALGVKAGLHVHPNYNSDKSSFDVGIVTLDRNLGDFTGHFGYTYVNQGDYPHSLPLHLLHYPAEHGYDGLRQLENSYTYTVAPFSTFSSFPKYQQPFISISDNAVEIERGSSGSPLFNNNNQVVGVLSGSVRNLCVDIFCNVPNIGTRFERYNKWTRFLRPDPLTDYLGVPSSWIAQNLAKDRRPSDKPMLVNATQWFNNPDLGTSTSSIETGEDLRVEAEVFNAGTSAATNVTVRFRLSSNSVYDDTDLLLGDRTISRIEPFSSKKIIHSFRAPSRAPGTYSVVWEINPQNKTASADVCADDAYHPFIDPLAPRYNANEFVPAYHNIGVEDSCRLWHHHQGSSGKVRYSDDDNEPDDSRSLPNPLPANTWLSDWSGLGKQYDSDYYRIDVPAGQREVVTDLKFNHDDGDIDLQLVDSSGNSIASSTSTNDDEHIDVVVPSAGTYYLRVHFGNKGNTYDLLWKTIAPPDLLGVSLDVTSTGLLRAGQNISLDFTTRNSGGAAAAHTIRFYVSPNAQIDPNTDALLGSYSAPAMVPGATHSATNQRFTLPFPGHRIWDNGDGAYYIGMVVDPSDFVVEANETNNSNQAMGVDVALIQVKINAYGTFAIYSQYDNEIRLPQFDSSLGTLRRATVSIIAVSGSAIASGPGSADGHTLFLPLGPYSFTARAIDVPASPSTHVALISYDTFSRELTGSDLTPFLNGEQIYRLPNDLVTSVVSGHTHSVPAVGLGVSTTFYFDPPPAELRGTSFKVTNSASQVNLLSDRSINVEFTVANAGPGPTPRFDVAFYISEDSYIDSSDRRILIAGVADGLESGQSLTRQEPIELPHSSDAFWKGNKTYYVGMIVDYDGRVRETNEGNNANVGTGFDLVATPITVKVPGIDARLMYESGHITIPRFGPSQGRLKRVEISSIFTNGATDAAGASVTVLVPLHDHTLSFDLGPLHYDALAVPTLIGLPHVVAPLSPSRVELTGSQLQPILQGDQVFSISSAITSSDNFGHHHVLTRADFSTEVRYYFDVLPNLRTSSLSLDGAIAPGATLAARYALENTGPGAASAFQVRFYLTRNDQAPTDGVFLNSANQAMLDPGRSSGTEVAILRLPGADDPIWAGSGGYTISAVVDPDGEIDEMDESDNLPGPSGRVTRNMLFSEVVAHELPASTFQRVEIAGESSTEQWYRIQAVKNGPLVVVVQSTEVNESIRLAVYKAPLPLPTGNAAVSLSSLVPGLVGRAMSWEGEARLDVTGRAGDVFYVRVLVATHRAAVLVANAMEKIGTTAYVYGTAGDDEFSTTHTADGSVFLNGVAVGLPQSGIESVVLVGAGGSDRYDINPLSERNLSIQDSTAAGGRTWLDVHALDTTFSFTSNTVNVLGFGSITVNGSIDLRMIGARSWHNPVTGADVDNDRFVSPIDAVLIINYLNITELPPRLPNIDDENLAPEHYLDVDDDGFISPIDAVLVINILNDQVVYAQVESGTDGGAVAQAIPRPEERASVSTIPDKQMDEHAAAWLFGNWEAENEAIIKRNKIGRRTL